jgi:hypothetical protein
METARSAAGQRNASLIKKHKQAAALSIFVAYFALFEYVPLAWHSEPSILILILIVKKGFPTQAYSPLSDQSALTALRQVVRIEQRPGASI